MADSLGVTYPDPNLDNQRLWDMMNVTTANLDRGNLEVALDHNAYLFVDDVLRDDRIAKSGTAIQGRIKLDSGGNAQIVEKYEEAQPHIKQKTYPFAVPWQHIRADFSWERHEILENAGTDEQLYDYADLQRLDALIDLANLVEEEFFGAAPAGPTEQHLWGVRTYAGRYEGTTIDGGYWGGLPNAGFSDIAGIAPCTSGSGTSAIAGGQPKWRNWCGGYNTIDATWVEQMDLGYTRMGFKAPLLAAQLIQQPFNRYRIFCNVESKVKAARYQRLRGDENTPEMGRMAGTLMFNGTPIQPTDCLDDDTDDPFFFVNRALFKAVVLKGDYLRRDGPYTNVNQPGVATNYIWLTVNLMLKNRRQGVACVNKF